MTKKIIYTLILLTSIFGVNAGEFIKEFSKHTIQKYVKEKNLDYSLIKKKNYEVYLIDVVNENKNLNKVRAYIKVNEKYMFTKEFTYKNTSYIGTTTYHNHLIVYSVDRQTKGRKELVRINAKQD